MKTQVYGDVIIVIDELRDMIYRFEKGKQTKAKETDVDYFILGDKHIIMSSRRYKYQLTENKYTHFIIDPITWEKKNLHLDEYGVMASQGDNIVIYKNDDDNHTLYIYNIIAKMIIQELDIKVNGIILNVIFSSDRTKYIVIEDGLHIGSYYYDTITKTKVVLLKESDKGYVWYISHTDDLSKFCVVIKYDDNKYGFIYERERLARRITNMSYPHYTEDKKLYFMVDNAIVEETQCAINEFKKDDDDIIPLYYKDDFEIIDIKEHTIDKFYTITDTDDYINYVIPISSKQ